MVVNEQLLQKGLDYQNKGNLAEAEKIYRQILQTNPRELNSLYLMGILATQKNNLDEALGYLTKALDLGPTGDILREIVSILTEIYIIKGDKDNAINYGMKLAEIQPDNPEVYFKLGILFHQKNDIDNAHRCYLNVLHLNPNFAPAHTNLGGIYFSISNIDLAIEHSQKAIEIDPNNAVAYNQLGNIYKELNEVEKAIECYRKALIIMPDSLAVKYNLGLLYLISKNFKEGWPLFESRIQCHDGHALKFPENLKPKWDGRQNINGKTVYVYYAIQNYAFGDSIMFARYLPLIASQGAKVICKPQPALYRLFKESDLNAEIVDNSVPDSSFAFDYQIPIMSLSNAFMSTEETIPLKDGYIKANPEKVKEYKEKYFSSDKFKIGIVWQSSEVNDRRSMPLEFLAKLAQFDGVEVFSLEKNPKIQGYFENYGIIDVGTCFSDFADTAAAIENLDLVITVDTATAHLAGAMGKPTWLMLQFAPNWRWFLKSETTAWYNSVKLFRQSERGNWEPVLAKIFEELEKKIGKR